MRACRGSDYRDRMKRIPFSPAPVLILCLGVLTGCGVVDRMMGRSPDAGAAAGVAEPVPEGPLSATAPLGGAQSAAALDQTSDAEKAAAVAKRVSGGEANLGSVVVALGSPTEQGFWLRSSLVTNAGKGRVVTADGITVNVDLQPGTGAALLSLAAYRALGLGLTDLPEVTVYAN